MKFSQFLKSKGAIGSIFMGVFYAIAMLGIFLPGYTALPGNMDDLKVAIINDDAGQYGAQISGQLSESLPFKTIKTDISNKKAMDELEHNKLALVVHIPEEFSANVQSGKVSASIDFTVNEASATMVSSAMSSVVGEINKQLSANFSEQTAKGVLMNFNVPEEQATAMATQIKNSYVGNYVVINDVPNGMHNNMLPMFLTMAGYVGAMIASMQLVASFKANRGKASKTKLFMFVQLTALLIAVLSTVVALTIAFSVADVDLSLLLPVAAQQILMYMAAFNVCAIMVFLVGEGGMVLNIPILLMQTIANGATMPRDMMYTPYDWFGRITPMYYSVQAYMAQMFGSISPAPFLWGLAGVFAGAMLINIVIVRFVHKPVPVTKEAILPVEVKNTAEITA
ncbi:ABC transporter permease [Paenibacillus sp. FSL F4-0125]|uniref:YhgE/Pip domain-containing protein n=1 Tax=Paenibacillus sp. FSL F4-0125 TaxID=2954730 RepID=UPI0030F853BF